LNHPAGVIELTDARVQRSDKDGKKFLFEVVTPRRTWSLAASSDEELDTWVNCIFRDYIGDCIMEIVLEILSQYCSRLLKEPATVLR
jgi:hypothetical protein